MVTPHYLKKVLKHWVYKKGEPDSELQAELIKNASLPKAEFNELRKKLENKEA